MPNGEPFDLLTVHVAKAEAETRILPTKLATLASYHVEEASNADKPRQIALGMSGMNWTLNDKIFEMEAVTLAETVKLGNLEVWEFVNAGNAGGMMGMMGDGMMRNYWIEA
ncbi:MAG: hypothetical protein NT075_29050 [Chloroflexi bacterium]|nr:hypothetical protein [Chloroflexota bacterium]